jgi:AAA15 family ATPase/GTPase
MNSGFFSNIKIENFKSLRSVEIKDCKRINLFIGRPNVGKSNILEALSMFSLKQSKPAESILFRELIRTDSEIDLFFNGDESQIIKIQADSQLLTYKYDFQNGLEKTSGSSDSTDNPILHPRKYIFQSHNIKNINLTVSNNSETSLSIPFGENLLNILQRNSKLLNECREFFKEYGLQFLIDRGTKTLRISKNIEGGELPTIFTIPYGSIADTLQRIIFYKAAIASNINSILMFEEPEAHSFPPFISHITQEIIHSTTNQFFITTHSPFITNDFLEEIRDELAIYVVSWKNGETVINKLSKEQLYDVYQYGVDLFYNIEIFD